MRAIKEIESGFMFSECSGQYSPSYEDRHLSKGLYSLNKNDSYYYKGFIGFVQYASGSHPNVGTLDNLGFVQFADGAIVQKRKYGKYSTIGCRAANYSFMNTPNTNDGKGAFGPNGSGEPLTVDGVEYGMKVMGFGKTKADIGTAADNLTRYVLDALPAGIVELGSSNRLMSGDNAWTSQANAYMWNPYATGDSKFEFSSRGGADYGILIGIPKTGLKTVVDVDGLTWDMPNGRYNSTKHFDAPAFTCRVSRGQDASVDLFTASIGGKEVLRKTGVKTSEPVAVDLAEWWKTAAYGTYDLVLSAGTGAKKSFDTTVRFSKVSTGIELTGKPADREKMPTACFVASAVVLGEQATEAWYVCNNANDSNPAWEEYHGGKHVFANKRKTADKWAVSWRAVIDNGASTRRSEILKHVGMAVM